MKQRWEETQLIYQFKERITYMKKYAFLISITIILSLSAIAQKYEEQYQQCTESLKMTGMNIDSLYFVRLNERDSCLAGSIAPNFKATSITGQEIELSQLKGQVVVLNFWFTKCQPCIQEMPALNQLVEHYAGKKVKFISFAPEEASILHKFFRQHPFNFISIPNSENIRRDKFKLFSGWPYTVIIDSEGKISKMWFGNTNEQTFNLYKGIIDNLL